MDSINVLSLFDYGLFILLVTDFISTKPEIIAMQASISIGVRLTTSDMMIWNMRTVYKVYVNFVKK